MRISDWSSDVCSSDLEDQRDAVLRGQRAQALEEARLRRQETLERLDDDAAELVVILADQAGGGLQVVERRDQHLVADPRRYAGGIRHRLREVGQPLRRQDRKSTRLNSSH